MVSVCGFHVFDLFYEIGLFVVELLVLGAVRVELGEEVHQLVLVPVQDVVHGFGFIRVRNEHLENT